MNVAFFGSKSYDKLFFNTINSDFKQALNYYDYPLSAETASLMSDEKAVCVFINDTVDRETLEILKFKGVKLIALRSAGYNHVDINSAYEFGLPVVRVPAYSPYSVAEYSVGLILSLNRKFHKSYNRVREGNFSIDGLIGFDLHNKIVGIIGTGKIGRRFAKIMRGFGCRVIANDPAPSAECREIGVDYFSLDEVLSKADIISLHCPLTSNTFHLLNEDKFNHIKTGAIIINTSRGKLIDTKAMIRALKAGKIGALGLDVYEEEEHLFFEDRSGLIIQDDIFARLMTFPNVLITSHQAFFTREAMTNIAHTTLRNITLFEKFGELNNEIRPSKT